MRTVLAAAVIGTMLGFLFTPEGSEAQTGRLFSTWITSPVGSGPPNFDNVTINCGWHANTGCFGYYYPNGPGLDWTEYSSQGRNVYYRGAHRLTNSGLSFSELRGVAQLITNQNYECDIVWNRVEEWYANNWHYRWEMQYWHSDRGSVPDIFQIPTNGDPTGVWIARHVANMTWDYGCGGTWYHVHDFAAINHNFPKAIPGWAENRGPAPNAIAGAPTSYQYPWPTYAWSRYFEWAEAYP